MTEPTPTPTFGNVQQIMELEEGVGPAPTAGTFAAAMRGVEPPLAEEDEEMNMVEGDSLDVEDDEEECQDSEMNPANYGALKGEVEKLRREVLSLRNLLDERTKELGESEEDRMHARIILQYEKDEKEKIQRMLYDEQRKTKQLRGELNVICGARSSMSGGEGSSRGMDDEEEITFLGEVKATTSSSTEGPSSTTGIGDRQNEPPSDLLSPEMINRPIIDRTKVYSTNRNNIGLSVGVVKRQIASEQPPPSLSVTVAPPPTTQPPQQPPKPGTTRRTRRVDRGIGTQSRPPIPSSSQQAVVARGGGAVQVEIPVEPSSSTELPTRTLHGASRTPRRSNKRRSVWGRARARNKNKSNFSCNLCAQRFLKLSLLKYHKRQIHDVDDLSLNGIGCVECGLVLPNRKKFLDHRLAVHSIPHPSGRRGTESFKE